MSCTLIGLVGLFMVDKLVTGIAIADVDKSMLKASHAD